MKRLAPMLVLALVLALAAGGVAKSAGTSRGDAVAAKKKCKKKKKKCRKGRGGASGPVLLRAKLTWAGGGGDTNYDLYVFDSNGLVGRGSANFIPQSQISNAVGTPGMETFLDLNFVKGKARQFSFGVCKQGGGNDGSRYTIDYVNSAGVRFSDSRTNLGPGFAAKYGPKGHAPVAPNGFSPCPAPIGG